MAATNIRFGRQPARRWRWHKLQQVSTLAGLALAGVLAVTVARSESAPQRATAPAEQESAAHWQLRPVPSRPEQIAYVLVTSEEGAARVRSWAWYEHALLAGEPDYRRTTYVPVLSPCGADLPAQVLADLASDAASKRVQVLAGDLC